MQTFLPEKDYSSCALVLDDKRLVKQLLECRQILTALAGESKGWVNHPATKMWRGYEAELLNYSAAIRDEMIARGFKWKNNWSFIRDVFARNFNGAMVEIPSWKTNEEEFDKIMTTHRANLYIKNPEQYKQYEESIMSYREFVCCDRCNYFWVTHTY